MKKRNSFVILILLTYALVASLAQANDGVMRLAQFSNENVAQLTYLRTKPQDDAETTFGYYKGAFLMILSEDTSGWCLVSIGNQQGYVRKEEITAADAFSSTATLPMILTKPESETCWLNLRQSPSLDAQGLKRLTMDEQAILLGITDDWRHVMIGDMLGYIKAEFTAFSDSYIELTSSNLMVSLYEPNSQQPASVSTGEKPPPQQNTTPTTPSASETKRDYQMRVYTEGPTSRSNIKIQYPFFYGVGYDSLNTMIY